MSQIMRYISNTLVQTGTQLLYIKKNCGGMRECRANLIARKRYAPRWQRVAGTARLSAEQLFHLHRLDAEVHLVARYRARHHLLEAAGAHPQLLLAVAVALHLWERNRDLFFLFYHKIVKKSVNCLE